LQVCGSEKRELKVNQINIRYHNMPIGGVVFGSFQGKLCLLDFGERGGRSVAEDRISRALNAELVEQDDEVMRGTSRQLDEYLEGQRSGFDIAMLMVGTDFQRRVWKSLMRIPYGTTSTYGQVAQDIASPRAVRAVGNACGANPIGIIVPCHRVIGSNGELVGYGGGLPLKRRLLALEQRNISTLAAPESGFQGHDEIDEYFASTS
jgi:methylated-DNA-[protein]-cysteine S-methyltransferase